MPPAGQVELLAVHDYLPDNGLDGPDHKAASTTAWTKKMLDKCKWLEQRRWGHHLSFDALEEPPSAVITTDGAELTFQVEGDPSAPVVVVRSACRRACRVPCIAFECSRRLWVLR